MNQRLFGALLMLALCGTVLLLACSNDASLAATEQAVAGGNAQQGREAIGRYGCGACHSIAGIPGADGLVGPPLTGIGGRAYIAGMLPNQPDTMVRWIMDPQSVVPGNAMPNMGVTEPDARDIAAYLATLTRQPK